MLKAADNTVFAAREAAGIKKKSTGSKKTGEGRKIEPPGPVPAPMPTPTPAPIVEPGGLLDTLLQPKVLIPVGVGVLALGWWFFGRGKGGTATS
jgi:hypothetical protein